MLEILIAYIKATFENSMPNITEVQGLAEKINEGDKQYPALYCTGGEYKHISALENYLYFRQTGSAAEEESEEESTTGCAYTIRRTYPMVAVAYIPKSVYNTDNAFIDGKIAQNIANIITKANWQSLGVTLKTENIYAEVGEINTNRHEVWASEYRGVDFAARLDHVYVSVEFDIVVEASEDCLQNYDCNDVEVDVEGDTITIVTTCGCPPPVAITIEAPVNMEITDSRLIGGTLDGLFVYHAGTEQGTIDNIQSYDSITGTITFVNDLGGVGAVKILMIL